MKYTYYASGSSPSISMYFESTGEMPVFSNAHPQWDTLVELAESRDLDIMTDEEVLAVINPQASSSSSWISEVEDRVTINTRGAFIDGIKVDKGIAQGLLNILGENKEDTAHLEAVSRFLQKAADNPNMPDSDKLYRWLVQEGLTLTSDGDFIGYKSVYSVDKDTFNWGMVTRPNGDVVPGSDVFPDFVQPLFRSTYSGGGIVDGVEFHGHVPNYVGAVVEMPRDRVDSNGAVECSVGLHVGTYGYASTFSGDHMLLVKVNPRDVVSVPDYDFTKLRACRYMVIASDVSGKLDSKLYIDEEFAPVYVDQADELTSEESRLEDPVFKEETKTSSIVSKIIKMIKSARS